ncbi:hypothetical protein [Roseomonas indoligenes]|uniref:Uncharacterized protein n=1 Tax=Roseomonas indoligenes TaxID=2820811 RepID=A0A940MX60_9PROT|nr:hypothetical protein [Pararoseomonas indoligenes]MBP0492121.1 hypothetical protein [Pararoseomonas indoligenes]
MIHHHGLPITPLSALYELAGRHFFVSFARPDQVRQAHSIGQSVALDNGAFSAWKRGYQPDWAGFYAWTDQWLAYPTTWAVIPDVIDAGTQEQDALLREWPHGKRQAAPVWHLDEPISRLLRLCDEGWSRVCMGSTAEYADVLSDAWERRMDECWNEIARTFARTPPIHMLRGLQLSGNRWPFASVDSTDIARNHNRPGNTPRAMADRWDAMQCPARWTVRAEQEELV